MSNRRASIERVACHAGPRKPCDDLRTRRSRSRCSRRVRLRAFKLWTLHCRRHWGDFLNTRCRCPAPAPSPPGNARRTSEVNDLHRTSFKYQVKTRSRFRRASPCGGLSHAYQRGLLEACENFSDLKCMQRAYRRSSGYLYKALYRARPECRRQRRCPRSGGHRQLSAAPHSAFPGPDLVYDRAPRFTSPADGALGSKSSPAAADPPRSAPLRF
jgi:hypothetical protein